MNATYKVIDSDGNTYAVAQPTPSAANRSAKMWAQTMHRAMTVVSEQTGEVKFTVEA